MCNPPMYFPSESVFKRIPKMAHDSRCPRTGLLCCCPSHWAHLFGCVTVKKIFSFIPHDVMIGKYTHTHTYTFIYIYICIIYILYIYIYLYHMMWWLENTYVYICIVYIYIYIFIYRYVCVCVILTKPKPRCPCKPRQSNVLHDTFFLVLALVHSLEGTTLLSNMLNVERKEALASVESQIQKMWLERGKHE